MDHNIQLVPVDDIRPSPHNPRRVRDDDPATASLATSIASVGLIQPPTVRPLDAGYELVAGERRWRASRVAGLEQIPVIVRDMSDVEARAVIVTENLQRQDLTPLEEASGVATLLADHEGDVRAVAGQLGRPVGWVARRARLASLEPAWRKVAEDPEHPCSSWSAGHLELIARLAPDAQVKLAEHWLGDRWAMHWGGSVADLEKSLAAWARDLAGAPWDVEAADVAPDTVSCLTCRRRSGCNPGLFDDELEVEAPGLGRCLDAPCWDRKLKAHVAGRLDAERAKRGASVLLIQQGCSQQVKDLGAVYQYEVQAVKRSTPGAVPALTISQSGVISDKVRWVLPPGKRLAQVDVNGEKVKRSLAEREAALEKRRKLHAIGALEAYLPDPDFNELPRVPGRAEAALIAVAAVVGTLSRIEYPDVATWDELIPLLSDPAAARANLWREVGSVLRKRLRCDHCAIERLWADAERIAELLEVDLEALLAKATEELPEPKAWARERETASPKKAKPARTRRAQHADDAGDDEA